METRTQAFRFLLVGLSSNALLYLLYLGVTALGLGHKTAMSILYALGVLQTFLLNKNWSFRNYDGRADKTLLRYLTAYATAYVLNLGVMIALVDRAGYSHRLVQGVTIVVVAVLMFAVQKHWVFGTERPLT